MNYPVWYLPEIGGGTLIALIAVTHVFVSHFAVGGGLYLVFAERKGLAENDRGILEFTRSHARFFLLMTAVFGAISGVGIWFVISLVNPGATSLLIHNYVFAWASEWVMFGVETVAIFVYFYTFGRMDHRTHQKIGWIYFGSAWLSLFFINGIICFMLSPGNWKTDGDFWSGFFNPTFWPSLFFRTFVALMFAGVYAFLTTSFLKDNKLKRTMSRFSGMWVLLSIVCAAPLGFWYLHAIPGEARALVEGASPTIRAAVFYGIWATAGIIICTLVLILIKPSFQTKPASFALFICAFLFMGAFEWTREAARRPFVINGAIYSNGLSQGEMTAADRGGFLGNARWAVAKVAKSDEDMEAGREIFKFQCYACHTVGGFNNDIIARTRWMTYQALNNYIANLHLIRPFMPPFAGNDKERGSLAAFITEGLQREAMVRRENPAGTGKKGKALFLKHCTICHPESLVKAKTAAWDYARIRLALDNLHGLQPAMPDFNGPPAEKDLIAGYIYSMNNHRMPESGVMDSDEGGDRR
jgi:mono/diheme cytochrome c family protein